MPDTLTAAELRDVAAKLESLCTRPPWRDGDDSQRFAMVANSLRARAVRLDIGGPAKAPQ